MAILLRAALALAACTLTCTAAMAQSGVDLSAQAPLVCRAGLGSPSAATGDATPLGELTAFCNDPDGYELWIDYPTDLAGRTLLVDGAAIPLSDTGAVRVVRTASPGSEIHSLALDGPPPTPRPISVTVRLIPVKATALALGAP